MSRIPRNKFSLYQSGISRCTRSAYLDLVLYGSSNQEIGIGVNSKGLLYTASSATVNTQAWAGASEIAALYDAYRIMAFDITMTFNQCSSSVTTYTATLPYMYVAKDYDDINTSAASLSDITQKPDAVQIALGRESFKGCDYKARVVPKIAGLAYGSAVASGYTEPRAKQWISTSAGISGVFTDPQHFGIKLFIDTVDMTYPNTTIIGNIRFFVKTYFELKHST